MISALQPGAILRRQVLRRAFNRANGSLALVWRRRRNPLAKSSIRKLGEIGNSIHRHRCIFRVPLQIRIHCALDKDRSGAGGFDSR